MGPKGKRRRSDQREDFEDEDFDAGMDDLDTLEQDEEDAESDDETAAQKRLRMGVVTDKRPVTVDKQEYHTQTIVILMRLLIPSIVTRPCGHSPRSATVFGLPPEHARDARSHNRGV